MIRIFFVNDSSEQKVLVGWVMYVHTYNTVYVQFVKYHGKHDCKNCAIVKDEHCAAVALHKLWIPKLWPFWEKKQGRTHAGFSKEHVPWALLKISLRSLIFCVLYVHKRGHDWKACVSTCDTEACVGWKVLASVLDGIAKVPGNKILLSLHY